jgi:competence protein ComEA
MKQSPTRSTGVLLLIATLAALLSSCGTLPRRAAPTPGSNKVSSQQAVATLKIKLNTATVRELEELPGVGRVLAERIVGHRNKYGPFRRLEHLMIVRGISERKFSELQAAIALD